MAQSLYIQISEQLIDKINDMEVGDLLPSERKLTQLFDVSRTTIRLALDDLESRGYINRQHGKGSFVVDYHKTLINLSEMYSFTEQMKSIGETPSTKLIDYSIVEADERLCGVFQNKEEKLIKLTRLRSSNDTPMLYEESYLPYSKFHTINQDDIGKRSLYDIFNEDFNEVVKLAQEEFSAGITSKKVAKQLEIDSNSAVLQIYRATLNIKNEMIEYTESKARPDKFSYRTVHHNRLAY